jgi:hypothetical protein
MIFSESIDLWYFSDISIFISVLYTVDILHTVISYFYNEPSRYIIILTAVTHL